MSEVYINVNSPVVALVFFSYGLFAWVLGYICNSDRGGE